MLNSLLESIKSKLGKYLNYLLMLVSVLLMISLVRNVLRINRVKKEISKQEEGLDELKAENQELKDKIEILGSEEYKEKQIRDKLGLAKEGELIVVLPGEEILRKLAPRRVEEEEVLPDPNWRKWAKLFF